jgi:putative hydrolase of the HAD superfamily
MGAGVITHLIFDLDDTLYAQDCGLWGAIGERINLYMVERLGLPAEGVPARRERYFRGFGTTLNGLLHDFRIDPADYLQFAHDLPLERYLSADPELDGMLKGLPQRKSIFTNADAAHARRVLACLGIAEHFAPIVDIVSLSFMNKPRPEAYQALLNALGAPPAECLLVEDSARNLLPARALGMTTVLVSPNGHGAAPQADFVVRRVHDVERIVHELGG